MKRFKKKDLILKKIKSKREKLKYGNIETYDNLAYLSCYILMQDMEKRMTHKDIVIINDVISKIYNILDSDNRLLTLDIYYLLNKMLSTFIAVHLIRK